MATKKMTALSIIPAENFSSGGIKRPNAVLLAAYAAGQPIESFLKLFNFKGYSMRCVFYSPTEIKLLVFEHSKKDKETKAVTVTSIMQGITLSMSKQKAWSADSLFNAADSEKLAQIVPTKMHDYPLIPLAQVGIFPKDNLHPTLSYILQTNYGMTETEGNDTATAMLAFVVERPAYTFMSPKQMMKCIETESMKAVRKNEFDAKKAKKALAASPATNDKF